MTLIVCEGPDGVGKSLLVSRLEQELHKLHQAPDAPQAHITKYHRSAPILHPLDEYALPLVPYQLGSAQHVLCDRWHVGESVYPQLTGRSTQLTNAVRVYIEMFLRARGAFIVQVDSTLAEQRLAARSETAPPHVETTRQFMLARSESMLSWRLFQSNTEPLSHTYRRQVHDVISAARMLEARARSVSRFQTYVGAPEPRVLFVGDVRHKLRDLPTDEQRRIGTSLLPGYAPYPQSSGEYLFSAVTLLGYTTRMDLGIINANDADDIQAFLHTQPQVRNVVVALGTAAHKTLKSLNVVHGAVPHPQYMQRFHVSRVSEYSMALNQAITGRNLLTWVP